MEKEILPGNRVASLWQEADELTAFMIRSRKTAEKSRDQSRGR